jgi:ankyrin repeat protein
MHTCLDIEASSDPSCKDPDGFSKHQTAILHCSLNIVQLFVNAAHKLDEILYSRVLLQIS